MEEAEEFETGIFEYYFHGNIHDQELYLIAFNYLYFPLLFSFVIFLLLFYNGLGDVDRVSVMEDKINWYCSSSTLPRSLCPPQEIQEMKINPSRNEPSPGLAIALMV
jgi:hypothetical protein